MSVSGRGARLLVALLGAGWVLACGIKAPPRPPLRPVELADGGSR